LAHLNLQYYLQSLHMEGKSFHFDLSNSSILHPFPSINTTPPSLFYNHFHNSKQKIFPLLSLWTKLSPLLALAISLLAMNLHLTALSTTISLKKLMQNESANLLKAAAVIPANVALNANVELKRGSILTMEDVLVPLLANVLVRLAIAKELRVLLKLTVKIPIALNCNFLYDEFLFLDDFNGNIYPYIWVS